MRNPLPPREEEELSSVFLKHPSFSFPLWKEFFQRVSYAWIYLGIAEVDQFSERGIVVHVGTGGGDNITGPEITASTRLCGQESRGGEKGGGGEKCVRFLPAAKSTTRLRLGSVSLSPPPSSSSLLLSAPLGRKRIETRGKKHFNFQPPSQLRPRFSPLVPVFSFPASSWESQSRTNKMGGQCGGRGTWRKGEELVSGWPLSAVRVRRPRRPRRPRRGAAT